MGSCFNKFCFGEYDFIKFNGNLKQIEEFVGNKIDSIENIFDFLNPEINQYRIRFNDSASERQSPVDIMENEFLMRNKGNGIYISNNIVVFRIVYDVIK